MAEKADVQQATVAKDSSAADSPSSSMNICAVTAAVFNRVFLERFARVCDSSNPRLGPLHLILLADIRVRYDLSGNRFERRGPNP